MTIKLEWKQIPKAVPYCDCRLFIGNALVASVSYTTYVKGKVWVIHPHVGAKRSGEKTSWTRATTAEAMTLAEQTVKAWLDKAGIEYDRGAA